MIGAQYNKTHVTLLNCFTCVYPFEIRTQICVCIETMPKM